MNEMKKFESQKLTKEQINEFKRDFSRLREFIEYNIDNLENVVKEKRLSQYASLFKGIKEGRLKSEDLGSDKDEMEPFTRLYSLSEGEKKPINVLNDENLWNFNSLNRGYLEEKYNLTIEDGPFTSGTGDSYKLKRIGGRGRQVGYQIWQVGYYDGKYFDDQNNPLDNATHEVKSDKELVLYSNGDIEIRKMK